MNQHFERQLLALSAGAGFAWLLYKLSEPLTPSGKPGELALLDEQPGTVPIYNPTALYIGGNGIYRPGDSIVVTSYVQGQLMTFLDADFVDINAADRNICVVEVVDQFGNPANGHFQQGGGADRPPVARSFNHPVGATQAWRVNLRLNTSGLPNNLEIRVRNITQRWYYFVPIGIANG